MNRALVKFICRGNKPCVGDTDLGTLALYYYRVSLNLWLETKALFDMLNVQFSPCVCVLQLNQTSNCVYCIVLNVYREKVAGLVTVALN